MAIRADGRPASSHAQAVKLSRLLCYVSIHKTNNTLNIGPYWLLGHLCTEKMPLKVVSKENAIQSCIQGKRHRMAYTENAI